MPFNNLSQFYRDGLEKQDIITLYDFKFFMKNLKSNSQRYLIPVPKLHRLT